MPQRIVNREPPPGPEEWKVEVRFDAHPQDGTAQIRFPLVSDRLRPLVVDPHAQLVLMAKTDESFRTYAEVQIAMLVRGSLVQAINGGLACWDGERFVATDLGAVAIASALDKRG